MPDYPHSVVVHDEKLFIAQTSSISYAPYIGDVNSVSADSLKTLVPLPGGRGHSSRTLKLGPDNELYVSRREPKLVRVIFTDGQASEVIDFMTGFQLPDGSRWARPVGVAIGPDGDTT
ncbi:MAG: hypothetical protein V3U76_18870 [Granulosicoccus sp.]